MKSQIIADALYQQLNMSFAFDQQFQDKLIVIAIADHTPYHLQLNLDFDFQYIKSVLLSKQFKIVSRTHEILKLKLSFVNFQFKNIDKLNLNTLKQHITELNNKMIDQSHKNTSIQKSIQQFRNQFDLMTKKMTDLHRENLEIKVKLEQEETHRIAESKRVEKLCEQKIQQLSQRMNQMQLQMLKKMEEERERNDKEEEKIKILMDNNLNKAQEQELPKFEQAILQMKQKIVTIEQRMKQIENVQQKLEEAKHDQSQRLRKVLQEKLSELEEKQLKKKIEEEQSNKLQSQRFNRLQERVKVLQNQSIKDFEEQKVKIDNKLTEQKHIEGKINLIQKPENIQRLIVMETESSRRQRHQKMGLISRTAICINGTNKMVQYFSRLVYIIKQAFCNIQQVIKQTGVDASFEIKFVIYRNYDSSEDEILQYSNFENQPKKLIHWFHSIDAIGGYCGNDAIQVCFSHLNSLQKLNQLIIISNSKANTESETKQKRRQKIFARRWKQSKKIKETYYETELKKLIDKKVKGHSYYLEQQETKQTKQFFEDLSKRTNGKCQQFKIDDPNAAKMFTDFLAHRILENIGELVSE